MDRNMERLAGIKAGDSNETCLAKTMLAISAQWETGSVTGMNSLIDEGCIYASEVLDARGAS